MAQTESVPIISSLLYPTDQDQMDAAMRLFAAGPNPDLLQIDPGNGHFNHLVMADWTRLGMLAATAYDILQPAEDATTYTNILGVAPAISEASAPHIAAVLFRAALSGVTSGDTEMRTQVSGTDVSFYLERGFMVDTRSEPDAVGLTRLRFAMPHNGTLMSLRPWEQFPQRKVTTITPNI